MVVMHHPRAWGQHSEEGGATKQEDPGSPPQWNLSTLGPRLKGGGEASLYFEEGLAIWGLC